jgi:predicted ATPase
MTTLLERTAFIGILESLFKGAMAGTGSLAIVSGEAGIGKTALLRSFLAAQNHVRAIFGYCGATEAARTLGPIEDLALQLPGSLRQRLV